MDLYYEAAVAGAIPLLRPLRESLAGDQLTRVVGIVNGTTNYILSRMAETGAGFAEALAEATELGYAEADPTADVDGFDAAAKAAILASLAFHTPVVAGDVYREGISAVTATDVARAAEIGCTVKLLAICEKVTGPDGDAIAVRVHPAMIPSSHPLAAVGGAFNAVFVEAEAAGELMFYGQGAGGEPTARAVLGDLVAVARNRVAGGAGPGTTATPPCPCGRWPTPRRATTSASTSPTARACWPPWPRSSPRTACASPPSARTVRRGGHPGDRHPPGPRRRPGGHRCRAARDVGRPGRDQRAARGGTVMTASPSGRG